MIINGNNIEELKKFDDNYFDSIVTDPPYEIGFMGKSWDASGIANNPEMWSECLRVLKPGGYLLSFSATRTYHRMAVAIEDSGFEIRDMIEWVYGSGFPKSLNIAKMIDKRGGKSVSWFGKWLRGWREKENIPQKEVSKLFPSKTGGLTGCVANWELGLNMPTNEQFNLICKTFNLPFESLEEAEREVLGFHPTIQGSGSVFNVPFENGRPLLTKGTSEFEGKGTALKPAHEPICMARKPLAEKTVAENVLKYGTGGINIDESRVENTTDKVGSNGAFGFKEENGWNKNNLPDSVSGEQVIQGRFPANLIHDNSEEVRECFPDVKTGSIKPHQQNSEQESFGMKGKFITGSHTGDSGNASRFFKSIIYQAKASKSERGVGNIHPTVKPVALMEYLIKMVTPTNGIVLDPFMGSGSTGVACVLNDFEFVGIDLDKDYCEIARARIEGVKETQTKMF
jgi:DNA modification methylase